VLLVIGDQDVEKTRDFNPFGIAILSNPLRRFGFLFLQQGERGIVVACVG
jgi:hypothetical protein